MLEVKDKQNTVPALKKKFVISCEIYHTPMIKTFSILHVKNGNGESGD